MLFWSLETGPEMVYNRDINEKAEDYTVMITKNAKDIEAGKTALGIEFGSTRIKAALVNDKNELIASGSYEWENRYENGLWTYSKTDILSGLCGAYSSLTEDVMTKYGVEMTRVGSIGISAMMHGYLVLDKGGELLVPFRTWRNSNAEEAAEYLTRLFDYHIPARWSVAHLYQAILGKEEHVKYIAFQTTLEGYVHYLLTGERVIGIGEGSGMFPVDAAGHCYDKERLAQFDALLKENGVPFRMEDILPRILVAGECAGRLTQQGASLLDVSGRLVSGIPLCPPEGDADTGMVATNSIRPRTGNVSAGTSIFGMVVLEKPLSKVYPEIDIVMTPAGDPVGMVHCNNCTSDINAWVGVFAEADELFGKSTGRRELFDKLYYKALEGDADCGGVVNYNYVSGEHIVGVDDGCPMIVRPRGGKLNLANLMRSLLYGSMATLKTGLDLLLGGEGVKVDVMNAHGGLFTTRGVCQNILASAIGAPVTVALNASVGGAWGMATLANYMQHNSMPLADYLDEYVFSRQISETVMPDGIMSAGFNEYMKRYVKGLDTERGAAAMF